MTTANAFKPLTKEDLANVLGVSSRTVENWVNEGTLPAPTKLGNRVYWHPKNFYAWLDLRLSVDAATSEAASTRGTEMESGQTKRKKREGAMVGKTELDKVRNRTQAQLIALMT